jgi:hypothetical protein
MDLPKKYYRNPRNILGESSLEETHGHTRVYPKVSGLDAWSENCKWYSSLPLGAVVSQYSEFYRHNPLCCFPMSVYCCRYCLFRYRLSPETFGYTLVYKNVIAL